MKKYRYEVSSLLAVCWKTLIKIGKGKNFDVKEEDINERIKKPFRSFFSYSFVKLIKQETFIISLNHEFFIFFLWFLWLKTIRCSVIFVSVFVQFYLISFFMLCFLTFLNFTSCTIVWFCECLNQ